MAKALKARLRTLSDLDGRTLAARRARDLVAALTADLGGDLSAAQGELVQRAGLLGAYLEDCEARWLGGDDVDLSTYLTACDRQRRVLTTLGLERRARDALTLGDLWRQEHAAKMVAAAADREAREAKESEEQP
jgi:hypothetical protein